MRQRAWTWCQHQSWEKSQGAFWRNCQDILMDEMALELQRAEWGEEVGCADPRTLALRRGVRGTGVFQSSRVEETNPRRRQWSPASAGTSGELR